MDQQATTATQSNTAATGFAAAESVSDNTQEAIMSNDIAVPTIVLVSEVTAVMSLMVSLLSRGLV